MDSVDTKVLKLLDIPGADLGNINGGRSAQHVIATIERAIRKEHGEKAMDIAFHLSDWSSDAAFLVALHLFPDAFTEEEIREGMMMFIIHAPNHVAAAAALAGDPIRNIFEIDGLIDKEI